MKKCRICGNSDIIYDRTIEAGQTGELKLCGHIEKLCTCGGIPPFQVFDDTGKPSWCVCRSARLKLTAVKKAFRDAEIPKKYLWKFIEDFDTVSDKARILKGLVSTTIHEMPSDSPLKLGYYFWGPAGTGKTLLACIMLQEFMVKFGLPGRYADLSRQFFQRLKDSYNVLDENYGESGRIMDELIKIPFLVIDDFGVQRNTDWESEMLYNLIDSRYSTELPTIITANMSIESYKDVAHSRIYSRVLEMCKIVKFNLDDYRDRLKQTSIEL
jgi:DNA replication protein DnaC